MAPSRSLFFFSISHFFRLSDLVKCSEVFVGVSSCLGKTTLLCEWLFLRFLFPSLSLSLTEFSGALSHFFRRGYSFFSPSLFTFFLSVNLFEPLRWGSDLLDISRCSCSWNEFTFPLLNPLLCHRSTMYCKC